ncbi:glycosyltransferase [Pectinatus haikarae]|uniref:glycosyltransferase n=1 Tax=Pectinatus haikarae TaxID=349096 RepID=UPI0018C4D3E3|nr:glycosyltransferase [Pectinatus haikarae]
MELMTSIIILTHNNLDYTKLCIKSIREYTKPELFEIIIVDNASNDGTVEWLKRQNDIKYILNVENKGFAGGCNQGIIIAAGTEILLLNNDTIVVPGWLKNLKRALYSSSKIGAVGPVTNNSSNWQSIAVDYKAYNWNDIIEFGKKYNSINDSKGWQKKIKLVGFCMLIKTDAIKKVGLLDERFFPGNFEDDDYSLRLIQTGYDLLQCNDTFIHHFGSVSFSVHETNFCDVLIENQQRFFDKWHIVSIYPTLQSDIYNKLKVADNESLLEIGCSCGVWLMELAAKYSNAKFYGIEKSPIAAAVAGKYVPVICGDIDTMELPYSKQFFDYIILPDLLPCVKEPLTVLRKIKPFLKNTGEIIISCRNIMHYDNLKKILSDGWSYENDLFGGALAHNHLRFFSYKTLEKLSIDAGLSIKECQALTKTSDDIEQDNSIIGQLMSIPFISEKKKWELKTDRYVIHLQKQAENINPEIEKGTNPKKICFITCVNNDMVYDTCVKCIHDLRIPVGYSVEILAIKDAVSMAQGYNQALKKTNAKYKIYLHQDVRIINKKIIFDILHLFRMNKKIGMIGTAGVYKIPSKGVWWEAKAGVGLIIHNPNGGSLFEQRFEEARIQAPYAELNAIDGNIMMTQYDLPWRQDLFSGWHFYDTSQCLEFIKKGYKVVVPDLDIPWNIHDCGLTKLANDYESARKIFLREYANFLDTE